MRHTQRRVSASHLSVDKHRCLYMRTLEIEVYALLFPRLRHKHRFLIPRIAYIVLRWCEEERELHLARLAVFLHVRVEIERRVVETAGPLSVNGNDVALVVGYHRTRQLNFIVILRFVAHHKAPLASEVYCLLCITESKT